MDKVAEDMAATGATIDQIARALNVERITLYDWRRKYERFNTAITRGRIIADDLVKESLYQRATGMTVTTTKTVIEHAGSKQSKTKIEETKQILAPDVAAAAFWLRNRCPTEFRDKATVDSR